ncbi:hypothetical protein F5Y16DRAFT_377296 [Xylariaceae sp. FL0255]|nr:hypothetical protein F5Y16DRAFT_377296 [Xylariaceae sp. FL0255]
MADLAELAGVPFLHLKRVVRLMATQSFLCEPRPLHVAHTHLSAAFVTSPRLFDAAMFLAECAAPSALLTDPSITSLTPGVDSPDPSKILFNRALGTATMFRSLRKTSPKLNRQWEAYLANVGGLRMTPTDYITRIFEQLNWSPVSNACIVEVGAQSALMAESLASLYPTLYFIVQINQQGDFLEPTADSLPTTAFSPSKDASTVGESSLGFGDFSTRITITSRIPGSYQMALGAAMYIVHLHNATRPTIHAELSAHVDVLRSNNAVMLILTPRLLPQPNSGANSKIEALARARDLTLLQLSDEGEMELSDLLEIISSVQDRKGKLVVVRELHSQYNTVDALVVKYQMDS